MRPDVASSASTKLARGPRRAGQSQRTLAPGHGRSAPCWATVPKRGGAVFDRRVFQEDWSRIAELERRYHEVDPGVADLSIVAVAGRLGTVRIATFD
jgi:hypothetical protein